ncbi:MAG: radical SAM protein [bacterium]
MKKEETPRHYPAAMVNITNRCTLRCGHCFIYRDENPNSTKDEMDTPTMLARLAEIQKRHGIHVMLWMGGEPMLRTDVLRGGVKLFAQNNITTNGTIDLIDLPNSLYVVSLDGPPDVNDRIRGKGTFDRVMKTLSRVPPPDEFGPTIMCQCVVTKVNEDRLEELVELLMPTRLEGMTFSFYAPPKEDTSGLTWGTLARRDSAVREVMRLKEKYPEFVWNKQRALELTLSENSLAVTRKCPSKQYVYPIWLDGAEFVHPFCCYGNDIDCDLCGAWVVFHIAAMLDDGDTRYAEAPFV